MFRHIDFFIRARHINVRPDNSIILESTRRPIELLYWASPRAEDLADYHLKKFFLLFLQMSN